LSFAPASLSNSFFGINSWTLPSWSRTNVGGDTSLLQQVMGGAANAI
jgi:hypothetical protein